MEPSAPRLRLNRTSRFAVLDLPFVTQGPSTNSSAISAPAPAATQERKEDEDEDLFVSSLSVDEKLSLALSVCEECIQEQELRALFEHKLHPIVYDGFEPSGRMHIAQGILRSVNVNKLTSCGCVFKFWVADWFAQLNNKMGGDLNKIRIVGRYMIEIWKAAGMNMQNVRFYWASEEINKRPNEYWSRVMEIARLNNVSRIQRCCTIMGRQEAGDMSSAQIFYPCMQCADVFFLKADICQLGMDQRKVNMLAREYCDQTKPKIKFKPVILSHHMLLGMKEGQEKMSKTEPDSAIFMEDSAQVVASKIKKAFCPPGVVEGNPVIDYIKYIVFAKFGYINITPLDGEEITYTNYEEFEREYINERIHPKEAKEALTLALNEMLEPVRVHFASGEPAKLLAKVSAFKITR